MYRLLKYQIFLLSKSKTLYLSVAFYFIYMFCIFLLPTTLSKYLTIKNLYFIRELDVLSINIIIFSIISAILVVLIFSTCIEDGSQIIIFSKPIKRWKVFMSKIICAYFYIFVFILANIIFLALIRFSVGEYNVYTNTRGIETRMLLTILWTHSVTIFIVNGFFLAIGVVLAVFLKKSYTMLIIIIFGIIINISYTIIPFFTGDRSISAVLHGNQDENTSLIANNGDGEIKMYIDGESVIQERKNLWTKTLSIFDFGYHLTNIFRLNSDRSKGSNWKYSSFNKYQSIEYTLLPEQKITSGNNFPLIYHIGENELSFFSYNTNRSILANPFDSIVYYNYKFITQNLTYQELISRDDLINFYELFFANCPNTSNRGQLNNYITQKLFNDKQYQLFATKADTFAQKNDVLCKFFFGMIFFCNYQLRNTFTENGVWELDYIDFDSTYYRYKANILNTSYFNKLNNLDHVYSYNEKNELISDINFEMLSGIKIPYSKMNKYISYRTNTLIDENYATIGILIFELITISIGIYISYRKDYN